jgi:hypothetical protein
VIAVLAGIHDEGSNRIKVDRADESATARVPASVRRMEEPLPERKSMKDGRA